MGDIQEYVHEIENAVKGKEVRSAIANGIRQCYEDGKAGQVDLIAREGVSRLDEKKADRRYVDNNVNIINNNIALESFNRAQSDDAVNARIDNLVVGAGGNSPIEVTDAHVGADGATYTTLKARLDGENIKVSGSLSQLDEYVDKIEQKTNSIIISQISPDDVLDKTAGWTSGYFKKENGESNSGSAVNSRTNGAMQFHDGVVRLSVRPANNTYYVRVFEFTSSPDFANGADNSSIYVGMYGNDINGGTVIVPINSQHYYVIVAHVPRAEIQDNEPIIEKTTVIKQYDELEINGECTIIDATSGSSSTLGWWKHAYISQDGDDVLSQYAIRIGALTNFSTRLNELGSTDLVVTPPDGYNAMIVEYSKASAVSDNLIRMVGDWDGIEYPENNGKPVMIDINKDYYYSVVIGKNKRSNGYDILNNDFISTIKMEVYNRAKKPIKLNDAEIIYTDANFKSSQGLTTDGTVFYLGCRTSDMALSTLKKISFDGQELLAVSDHCYGHVNGIGVCNGKLYIAEFEDGSTDPQDGTTNFGQYNIVSVADAETLAYERSFSINEQMATLGNVYVKSGQYAPRHISDIQYNIYNDTFVCLVGPYLRSRGGKNTYRGFAIFDTDWNLIDFKEIWFSGEVTNPHTGGITFDDHFVYLSSNGTYNEDMSKKCIFVFTHDFHFVNAIYIKVNSTNECENIAKVGNRIYVNVVAGNGNCTIEKASVNKFFDYIPSTAYEKNIVIKWK